MGFKNFRLWSVTTVFIVCCVALFFSVLKNYPLTVVQQNLNGSRSSLLTQPWPQSAAEEWMQERKKVKKFAKSEQLRRALTARKRMQWSGVTLFDPSLDSIPADVSLNPPTGLNLKSHIPWTGIDTQRKFSGEAANRLVSYMAIPTSNGTELHEGLLCTSGSEIRFSFGISKNSRNLVAQIIPLSPGTIQVFIGQTQITKVYTEKDIHTFQKLVVPIVDSTATQLRIVPQSTNILALDLSIMQMEKYGRMPIQVSQSSALWKIDPEQTDVGVEDETADLKDLDNLWDIRNQQVPADSKSTLALGYNVLLLQFPEIPSAWFAEDLGKIAPHLAELMGTSAVISGTVPSLKSSLFRQTIFPSLPSGLSEGLVLKQSMENRSRQNLYLTYRNFGYKSTVLAPASTLGFNSDLALGNDVPNLESRWLDTNDQRFNDRSREIDSEASPAKGLEAIFLSDDKKPQPSLNDEDFNKYATFLQSVVNTKGLAPDWRANEIILPDNRTQYLARTVDWFQKWSKTQMNTRFFCHMYLDATRMNDSPSLGDLGRSLVSKKSNLFMPSRAHHRAQIAMLDRSLQQILESLKARNMDHRTVIGVILPMEPHNNVSKSAGDKLDAKFLIRVPGLIPSVEVANQQNKADLKSFLVTLNTVVGISDYGPHERQLSLEEKGAMQKNLDLLQVPQIGGLITLRRYNLTIWPSNKKCESFWWAADQKIINFRASLPITESDSSGKKFQIFPCALGLVPVHLTWYQEEQALTENTSQTGGQFVLKKGFLQKNFLFLFGPKLVTSSDGVMALPHQAFQKWKEVTQQSVASNGSEIENLLQDIALNEPDKTLVHLATRNVSSY